VAGTPWGVDANPPPRYIGPMGAPRRGPVGLATLIAALALGACPLAAAVSGPHLPRAPACAIFPATNVWNARVDALPVAADSGTLLRSIGLATPLHPDFGSYAGYGIPYNVVSSATPRRSVRFDYASESNRGPYPIPRSPRIEGGSDRHLISIDRESCRLYEMWNVRHTATGWRAGSGAIWDMQSNHLRPDGWTSADAAGLPILPGLVRYSEVRAGEIRHALRFTAPQTRRAYLYPARHFASSSTDPALPPMGLRVRLKASFDVSRLAPQARRIAVALQRYGMILADNGSAWYVSGASNPEFDDDQLRTLRLITGADLEVVDTSTLRNG
jgi:hypothetical protein